jgi:hypothetical protein
MILAPSFRHVEGPSSPSDDPALPTADTVGLHDGTAPAHCEIPSYLPVNLPILSLQVPRTVDPLPSRSIDEGTRSAHPSSWRFREPKRVQLGDPSARNESAYLEIFGAHGSIQRCKEEFVASGFSPRKTIRSSRALQPPVDFGKAVLESTDVCFVAALRASHAA